MMFRHLSIRPKVWIAMTLVAAISVALSAGGMLVIQTITFEQRADAEMLALAELVGVGVNSPVYWNDKDEARRVLDRLHLNSEIEEAHVFLLPDRQVFASIPSNAVTPQVVLQGNPGITRTADGIWLVADLVDYEKHVFAGVALRSSLRGLYKEQERSLLLFGIVTGITILLAFVFARVFQRELTRPLSLLASTVRQVTTTGDHGLRVTKISDDEVGMLAEDVNGMLAALQLRILRFSVLREISILYSRVLDLRTLCEQVHAVFPKYFPSYALNILIYDELLGGLVSEQFVGLPRPANSGAVTVQKPGESISGLCYLERRPVVINNCATTDIIPQQYIEEFGLKSCVAVPIVIREDVVGVLRIDETQRFNAFDDDDVEFYVMLADQIGVAIENNRLFEERGRAEEQIRRSLEEKETLLKELYHRTKNNMQVIRSLLSVQAGPRPSAEVRKLVDDMETRIQAMSLVHEKLYQSRDLSIIDMKEYIQDLVSLLIRSFGDATAKAKAKVDLSVESVPVTIDVAIPCGLIINELISNAFKYAFPGDRKGTIAIRIHRPDPDELVMIVSDDGVGVQPGFDFRGQKSLGMWMIHNLAEQLDGKVCFEGGDGVRCTVSVRDTGFRPRV